jgi:hypothetical protein
MGLAVISFPNVTFGATMQKVESRVLAQFEEAEADAQLLLTVLIQSIERLKQASSGGKAYSKSVALLIVVAGDCVRLATAGMAVREEIAARSSEDFGHCWGHNNVKDIGVIIVWIEGLCEGGRTAPWTVFGGRLTVDRDGLEGPSRIMGPSLDFASLFLCVREGPPSRVHTEIVPWGS